MRPRFGPFVNPNPIRAKVYAIGENTFVAKPVRPVRLNSSHRIWFPEELLRVIPQVC